MKKLFYLIILVALNVLRTSAQETNKAPEYKVPGAYHFDYKVVYEVNREEKKATETMSYYFTKNGDYMSIETSDSEKEKDMNFMVSTRDAGMV